MKKSILFLSSIILLFLFSCQPSDTSKDYNPTPSDSPNKHQLSQIARQYGMFLHFGINTFHDEEWTDGTKPAKSYSPTKIDADQWILSAKSAGMKYVILTAKHHDGFCLWDSQYTDYDISSSSNPTDVIKSIAQACKKHDIGLGLYYSLWDRNRNSSVKDTTLDTSYNNYMINQLNELMDITSKYCPLVEFWFDGGWVKENYRWPIQDIYNTIKRREPGCQIGINWSIGLPDNPDYHAVYPEDQKEGYPIRYFPSDFRLGDPYLPANPDPKLFTYNDNSYYMPWESTVCISQRWFYNTQDSTYKTLEELATLYKKATAQDNILILNCPPNRDGVLRSHDVLLLKKLRKYLGI